MTEEPSSSDEAPSPLMEEAKEKAPAFGLDAREETPNFPTTTDSQEELASEPQGWTRLPEDEGQRQSDLGGEAPQNTIAPG